MCFNLERKLDFFLKRLTLWLSQCTTYFCYSYLNSCKKCFIYSISLQATITVINIVTMVDKTTHFCNFDFHDTAPPENVIRTS